RLVLPAHGCPHVRVHGVGALDRLVRIDGDVHGTAEVAGAFDDVVVQLVSGWRGDGQLDAAQRRGEGQRGGDVVAVADEHDATPVERAQVLAQGQHVGERLTWMRTVRQQVHDGHV